MIDPRTVLIGRRVRLWGVWMALVFALGGCLPVEKPSVTILPVNSLLYFSFEDSNDNLYLTMRSDNLYGTGSVRIAAEISQIAEHEILVDVQGIAMPNSGTTAPEYATVDLPIPDVTGVFTLTIAYADVDIDTYTLFIDERDVSVTLPTPPLFTYPERLEWKRLPRGAMWILVSNTGVPGPYTQHFYADRDEYRRQVERFYAGLEKLGVEHFSPENGYYTATDFIPPFPNQWSSTGQNPHFVDVANQNGWSLSYNMPLLTYFVYTGEWGNITALIDAYQDSDLGIRGYNWRGDNYGTGRRPQVTATPWPTPVPSVLSTPSPLATPGTSGNFGD